MKLPRPSTAGWLALPGWRRGAIAYELVRTIERDKATRAKRTPAHEAKVMLALLLSVDPDLAAEIERWRADVQGSTPAAGRGKAAPATNERTATRRRTPRS